jgi:hypothetical protein
MLKALTRKLITVCLLVSAANASATLLFFTDRAAWETAVGTFETEDFNSFLADTDFTNSTLLFDDFSLVSGALNLGNYLIDVTSFESNPGTADIDGSPRVNINGAEEADFLTIQFNFNVFAAGFDTVNYDIDNDLSGAFAGITSLGIFPSTRGETGFIGVIDSSGNNISSIDIVSLSTSRTFNALDNISYAQSDSTSISTPGTLAIFSISLCAFALRRRTK